MHIFELNSEKRKKNNPMALKDEIIRIFAAY